MAGIDSQRMQTDVWLTPPEILAALGPFDLDPCAAENRPWDTAAQHYTKADDGLSLPWRGRVWCNPPYSREARRWLAKLSAHGCGTALVFARTETAMFFETVWRSATARGLLFMRGRVRFYRPDGMPAANDCGAPSVLIAYGPDDANRLRCSGIDGKFISL